MSERHPLRRNQAHDLEEHGGTILFPDGPRHCHHPSDGHDEAREAHGRHDSGSEYLHASPGSAEVLDDEVPF